MNETISLTEAWKSYSSGDYVMKVPPVCNARWSDLDWIRWIFPNLDK